MTLKSFIQSVVSKRVAGGSNSATATIVHGNGTTVSDLSVTVELDNTLSETTGSISHIEEVVIRFDRSQIDDVFVGAILTIDSVKYQYVRTIEKFDSHMRIVFRRKRTSVTGRGGTQ